MSIFSSRVCFHGTWGQQWGGRDTRAGDGGCEEAVCDVFYSLVSGDRIAGGGVQLDRGEEADLEGGELTSGQSSNLSKCVLRASYVLGILHRVWNALPELSRLSLTRTPWNGHNY